MNRSEPQNIASRRAVPRNTSSRWIGGVVVGLTVVAAYAMGTRLWFFSDEWNIIASYHRGHLLDPFNSHLSAVPVGLYQGLFHSVGLGSYTPYRLLGLASYALLGWMTWRYARTRMGAAAAALVTAALVWNSSGVSNVMFPFLMNFSLPVACLVAIWWHFDHETERHDLAASFWLIVALGTSGLGLMVTAAVGAELLVRRASFRRWLIMSIGPILWLVWYLKFGVSNPATGGVGPVLRFAGQMLFSGISSLVGGNHIAGAVLTIIVLMLLIRTAVIDGFTARLTAALVAPLSFALLTAISRVGATPSVPPEELRYQWTIAVFVVLMLIHLVPAAAVNLTIRKPALHRSLFAIASVFVLINTVQLLGDIRHWESDISRRVRGVRDNLWVVDFAARHDVVDRTRIIPVSYVPVKTGDYLNGIAGIGNPLEGEPGSAFGGFEDARDLADEAFVAQSAPLFATMNAELCQNPKVLRSQAFAVSSGSRLQISVASQSSDSATVHLRLFGLKGPGPVIGTVTTSGALTLQFPELGSDAPVSKYWVTTSAPTEVFVCPQ